MKSCARFQIHFTAANIVFAQPRFEHVVASWQIAQPISAVQVRLLKEGSVEDQDRATHRAVHFAVQRDDARFIEQNRLRLFVSCGNARDQTASFSNTKKRCDTCRRDLET